MTLYYFALNYISARKRTDRLQSRETKHIHEDNLNALMQLQAGQAHERLLFSVENIRFMAVSYNYTSASRQARVESHNTR